MSRLLQPIREIPGVDGAFLFGVNGLVERDAPAYFADDVLGAACERAHMVFDALEEDLTTTEDFVLHFAAQSLFLRRCDAYVVAVIAQPRVHGEAVRVATNLLRRRLAQGVQPPPSSGASSSLRLPVPTFPSLGVSPSTAVAAGTPPSAPGFAPGPTSAASASGPVRPAPAPTSKAVPKGTPPSAVQPPSKKPKSKIWG